MFVLDGSSAGGRIDGGRPLRLSVKQLLFDGVILVHPRWEVRALSLVEREQKNVSRQLGDPDRPR